MVWNPEGRGVEVMDRMGGPPEGRVTGHSVGGTVKPGVQIKLPCKLDFGFHFSGEQGMC